MGALAEKTLTGIRADVSATLQVRFAENEGVRTTKAFCKLSEPPE